MLNFLATIILVSASFFVIYMSVIKYYLIKHNAAYNRQVVEFDKCKSNIMYYSNKHYNITKNKIFQSIEPKIEVFINENSNDTYTLTKKERIAHVILAIAILSILFIL